MVISFIGLQTQEVKIQPVMKVVLHADTEVLDEVVVVAYGTQKRASITGAVSSVSAGQIEKRPVTNVTSALEGTTTGVQVNSTVNRVMVAIASVSVVLDLSMVQMNR